MSEKGFVNVSEVILPHDCSREGVSHLHRLLSDHLARLPETDPAPERVGLDFSQVREIDACGCQLLALFAEQLALRGIAAASCRLGKELADSLALLGFSALLGAAVGAGEEGSGSMVMRQNDGKEKA